MNAVEFAKLARRIHGDLPVEQLKALVALDLRCHPRTVGRYLYGERKVRPTVVRCLELVEEVAQLRANAGE